LYREGYQEDAAAALTQIEAATGFSDGLMITGSVLGLLGLVLLVKHVWESLTAK